MDVDRFDALSRSLSLSPSRRDALHLLAGSALVSLFPLATNDAEAHNLSKKCKKKSGKAKKKCLKTAKQHEGEHADEIRRVTCSPRCAGKQCGDNGCGGSCGTCSDPCTECQGGLCVAIAAGNSCASATCAGGTRGFCDSTGACQCPVSCSVDTDCPHSQCQNCDGTVCVVDSPAVTAPCDTATCEDGRTEGDCDLAGQCQCRPKQTCFQDTCGECQRCNETHTACEFEPSSYDTPCFSGTCEAGMEGRCHLSGECLCQPVRPRCDPASCGECQRCDANGAACEVDGAAVDTPCSSVTCEAGTQGFCNSSGQCQCQAAAPGVSA